ncbi:hypothetical protein N1030_10045 [Desulfovibrio mangrovi]|uniref:hypothetical protein n=1 Tax=Desulfovibrio mangrovi TaxID=2976983 RepID=UPI002245C77A|nr:hypothetical protein [Desulfovibrio mangrovi]UZP65966.1 hypothetical protein N1030_10045 [Desulfovibrio mangrovi]
MKRILSLLLVSLFLLVAGCGAHEGVVRSPEEAWISFAGDTRGAILSLDGAEGIELRPATYAKDSSSKRKWYQVAPGKHSVRIIRNGNVVVDRVILVDKGQTKEIYIP